MDRRTPALFILPRGTGCNCRSWSNHELGHPCPVHQRWWDLAFRLRWSRTGRWVMPEGGLLWRLVWRVYLRIGGEG